MPSTDTPLVQELASRMNEALSMAQLSRANGQWQEADRFVSWLSGSDS